MLKPDQILGLILSASGLVSALPTSNGNELHPIESSSNGGLPFSSVIESAESWPPLNRPRTSDDGLQARQSCDGLTPDDPTTFWYESILHNGQSSFQSASTKAAYTVFRNVVTDFGADNTGATDASVAIQNAINAGASNGPERSAGSMGTTGQPAMIYLPAGTYLMKGSLQLFVGTLIIGDAINPPTLKADSVFPNDHIVYGKDPNFGGTVNFYIGVKNIIIDSTSIPASQSVALLDWTVSQGTQLTNIVFNMPDFSVHVGVTSQYDFNSMTILNDLTFFGGTIALDLVGQQCLLKGITITGATTGISLNGFDFVCQQCSFADCAVGVDASAVSGSFTMIDSSGSALGTLVSSSVSGGTAENSIVLDNVQYEGNTVTVNGDVLLTGSVTDTWVHGNLYSTGNNNATVNEMGTLVSTQRSSALLDSSSKYFTMAPPTYSQFSASQFVNIKSVSGLPVFGDGATDDTANINAILESSAGCALVYIPAGTYIVTDTIFVPVGSRIFGDAFASVISASGSKFSNAESPIPMFQVGNSGDVGVGQISDMLFTVADILPGCKLVEVNMKGSSPGDVGFWNSHARIGGAVGSLVETDCGGSPADCMAVWGVMHLTSTSSAYIENMWGWCADHDLDASNSETISSGRGMLVESTSGSWLVGTAMEHHTLYQYNFHGAENVVSTFQQSETPYWQGTGQSVTAPAPWTASLIAGDPTFTNCAASDAQCRMAFFELIQDSEGIYLYGGGIWTFFNDGTSHPCTGDCQQNAIQIISSSESVYLYATNVKAITNMILEGTVDAATEKSNAGGWGGVIAAYLLNSGLGSISQASTLNSTSSPATNSSSSQQISGAALPQGSSSATASAPGSSAAAGSPSQISAAASSQGSSATASAPGSSAATGSSAAAMGPSSQISATASPQSSPSATASAPGSPAASST